MADRSRTRTGSTFREFVIEHRYYLASALFFIAVILIALSKVPPNQELLTKWWSFIGLYLFVGLVVIFGAKFGWELVIHSLVGNDWKNDFGLAICSIIVLTAGAIGAYSGSTLGVIIGAIIYGAITGVVVGLLRKLWVFATS